MPELRRQSYCYMRGHMAALAVQWSRTRQLGEPRRMLVTLPRYYLRRGLRKLWWQVDDPALAADVQGYLAGLVRAAGLLCAPPPPLSPKPAPGDGAVVKAPVEEFVATNPFPYPRTLEIGRASCRERV